MATTARPRPESRRAAVAVLVALGGAGAAGPALADRWTTELGVDSRLEWTSNSDFGNATTSREDTIVNLRPRIAVRGEGARLRVAGTAVLDGVAYANHTQDSRVQPEADLSARLEAVERLFFLEAGYRAIRASVNPFGVQADAGTTTNSVTTSQSRFSPVIEGGAPGEIRYSLRADNSWVREIGAAEAGSKTAGYFGRYSALVERTPQPLGWRVEAERDYTRYKDDSLPSLGVGFARAALTYALNEELRVGARAGRETSSLIESDTERRSTAGVELHWVPSPRTTLDLSRDKRFFGTAWQLAFNHRMPMLAWKLDLSRTLDTTPQALFDLPATTNVAGLLDAMFTTRFPDPVERARVVQDLIDRNGLPTSTTGPSSLLANRVSLVTRRSLSLAFNGVRNTLTIGGFHVRTEDAEGNNPLATGEALGNNIQYGGSVGWNHRVTPSAALNVSADWTRIHALPDTSPDQTTQHGITVQLSLQASPKTNAYLGGRYRKIESTVVPEGKEGAVFVGMDHRF